VAHTVGVLQDDYLRQRAAASATLARLRAAAGKPAGSSYHVLDVTTVPPHLLGDYVRDDEPTDTEHAMHAALTLYATHQQSHHDAKMHQAGTGLGAAVGFLAHASTNPETVRRRFAALGTARTFDEAVYHVRSLVYQLREKKIPLDYGLLADDLSAFQRSDGAERIRATWGREFYRNRYDERAASTDEITKGQS
jgi:CRISPR system Cascade subunit CasB